MSAYGPSIVENRSRICAGLSKERNFSNNLTPSFSCSETCRKNPSEVQFQTKHITDIHSIKDLDSCDQITCEAPWEMKYTSPFQHKTSPSFSWGWIIGACPRKRSWEAKNSRIRGGWVLSASGVTKTRWSFWASGPIQGRMRIRWTPAWDYEPRAALAICNLWDTSDKAMESKGTWFLKSNVRIMPCKAQKYKPDAKKRRCRTWQTKSRSSASKFGTVASQNGYNSQILIQEHFIQFSGHEI